jgi:hypothetical protein
MLVCKSEDGNQMFQVESENGGDNGQWKIMSKIDDEAIDRARKLFGLPPKARE